jgi:RND family efflux transporter MFP subunit
MFKHLNLSLRWTPFCRRSAAGARLDAKPQWALLVAASLTFAAVSCMPDGQAKVEEKPAVHARTAVIRPVTVTEQFQAPGTVQAKTHTVLSARVFGQILALPVREGDRVRNGQLVAEIESREASAQLRRAQAGEIEARRALEEADGAIRAAEAAVRAAAASRDLAFATRSRYDILRTRRSVSPQEFDEVDTRYKAAAEDALRAAETLEATRARRMQVLARIEQAEAEVETAQVTLGYMRITSPIDGVITSRKADPGVLATPGMPLVEIDDDSSYQLECMIEESRAAAVRVGQKARVQIDALSTPVDAVVSLVVPASDPATRTYTIKLDLALQPTARRELRSGSFGRALLPGVERQALIVPEPALIRRGQLVGIYVVQDDAALLRLVKTGRRYEPGIEILSGLSEGARVIIAPVGELADGSRIIEAERAP